MPDYTKVTITEEDGNVFIYRPRCPTCDENMVQGIFEYYRDVNDNGGYDRYSTPTGNTFEPNRMYKKLLYVCKEHKDKQVLLTNDQLGTVNLYVKSRQQFVSYPRK